MLGAAAHLFFRILLYGGLLLCRRLVDVLFPSLPHCVLLLELARCLLVFGFAAQFGRWHLPVETTPEGQGI